MREHLARGLVLAALCLFTLPTQTCLACSCAQSSAHEPPSVDSWLRSETIPRLTSNCR